MGNFSPSSLARGSWNIDTNTEQNKRCTETNRQYLFKSYLWNDRAKRSQCCIVQVTRITGAFSYWESDIMRVNPAVVLMKFLPLAVTIVNVATAFVFSYSCIPFMANDDSHHVMVNCTPTHSSSVKYETKC